MVNPFKPYKEYRDDVAKVLFEFVKINNVEILYMVFTGRASDLNYKGVNFKRHEFYEGSSELMFELFQKYFKFTCARGLPMKFSTAIDVVYNYK